MSKSKGCLSEDFIKSSLFKTLILNSILILFSVFHLFTNTVSAQKNTDFKVIAFYTAKSDKAHISFVNEANEWYRWENDLRKNPDIKILASIDSSSFPLGNGPKPNEIWHSGYYPVVWTNMNYRMIYINMGHNDIDYENGTDAELTFTFKNTIQNKLVIDALFWLGKNKNEHKGK